MGNDLIAITETFVKQALQTTGGNRMVAHGFAHIDRVRNMAMHLGRLQRLPDLELIEVTALLHDIGLTRLTEADSRYEHGPLGAGIAASFLSGHSDLDAATIRLAADAIAYHGLRPSVVRYHLAELGERGWLLMTLRDADVLDGLGAIGVLRTASSRWFLPEYSPEFPIIETGVPDEPLAPVYTIANQINQQIRNLGNLHTGEARAIAQPRVQFMKDFLAHLDDERAIPSP